MGITDTLERLYITARQYFGADGQVSQRYDSGAGQYVQRDEANDVDQVVIDDGNDLTDELEENGAMELVIGNLLNFDPERVIVDTRANQPADPAGDTLMVVTDDQVIEHYDGNDWTEQGAAKAALVQGGASEIDAAELAGSSGQDGQVLQTDGNSVSWAGAQGVGMEDIRAYNYVFDNDDATQSNNSAQ